MLINLNIINILIPFRILPKGMIKNHVMFDVIQKKIKEHRAFVTYHAPLTLNIKWISFAKKGSKKLNEDHKKVAQIFEREIIKKWPSFYNTVVNINEYIIYINSDVIFQGQDEPTIRVLFEAYTSKRLLNQINRSLKRGQKLYKKIIKNMNQNNYKDHIDTTYDEIQLILNKCKKKPRPSSVNNVMDVLKNKMKLNKK